MNIIVTKIYAFSKGLLLPLFFMNTAFASVEIETWKTSSGSKVLFVQSTQLPMVDIDLTFDAGSVRDGELWGLASMTSVLIGTATSSLNEEQITTGFDELGAQFGVSAGRDSASISLRTLTRPEILAKSTKLFEQVVSDNQFNQGIYDREYQRLLIGLEEEKVSPQSMSNKALWKTLYGTHPYAHPVSGTEESVQRITLKAIEQFYKQHYVAQNAVVAIVGDVSRKKAADIAETLTAKLPQGERLSTIPQPVQISSEDSLIEFDSTQTYYTLTQIGVERNHPDYVPLFVANHAFGGSGFGSMLMEEVREKRGLVYSVYSYFAPLELKGPFLISLSTKNASAYEADAVVKQTLQAFETYLTDEKLNAIKDNLIGGFPLRMDSNAKILGYLSLIGFYDLPLNYLEWFPSQVEKLARQDVIDAWNRHIDIEKMARIMVGKPE